MVWSSGVIRSGCSPKSRSSSVAWGRSKSGSTSPSACSRRIAIPNGSRGRARGHGRHPRPHPHFRWRRLHRDVLLADRPRAGRPDPRQECDARWPRGTHRARRTQGSARPGARGGAARGGGASPAHGPCLAPAREEPRGAAPRAGPMNASELGVLIPINAVSGFFAWMIALTLSKTYAAKLKAQTPPAGATGQEEGLAAIDELRREGAELAGGEDFTGGVRAKARAGEAGKRGLGERRTGTT